MFQRFANSSPLPYKSSNCFFSKKKRTATSSIPTFPLCLRAKKHQRSNARGHKGHRSTWNFSLRCHRKSAGGWIELVMNDQVESGFLLVLGVFWANSLGYSIDIQGHLVRFGIWTPRNMPKTPKLRRYLDPCSFL